MFHICIKYFDRWCLFTTGKHCRKPHCRNGVVDTFGPVISSRHPNEDFHNTSEINSQTHIQIGFFWLLFVKLGSYQRWFSLFSCLMKSFKNSLPFFKGRWNQTLLIIRNLLLLIRPNNSFTYKELRIWMNDHNSQLFSTCVEHISQLSDGHTVTRPCPTAPLFNTRPGQFKWSKTS